MILDVRTTSTAWDGSLGQLGDFFDERLRAATTEPAGRPQPWPEPEDNLTVRIGALGLTDAYQKADSPDGYAVGTVVPIWVYGATALVGPRFSSADTGEAGTLAAPPGPCPTCVERR